MTSDAKTPSAAIQQVVDAIQTDDALADAFCLSDSESDRWRFCFVIIDSEAEPKPKPLGRVYVFTDTQTVIVMKNDRPLKWTYKSLSDLPRVLKEAHTTVIDSFDDKSPRVPVYRDTTQIGREPRTVMAFVDMYPSIIISTPLDLGSIRKEIKDVV